MAPYGVRSMYSYLGTGIHSLSLTNSPDRTFITWESIRFRRHSGQCIGIMQIFCDPEGVCRIATLRNGREIKDEKKDHEANVGAASPPGRWASETRHRRQTARRSDTGRR